MTRYFELEKNIPMPPLASSRHTGKYSTYPLKAMAVGDSFIVKYDPTDDEAYKKIRSKLNSAVFSFGTRNDRKFSVRTYHDENFLRCWRVS